MDGSINGFKKTIALLSQFLKLCLKTYKQIKDHQHRHGCLTQSLSRAAVRHST